MADITHPMKLTLELVVVVRYGKIGSSGSFNCVIIVKVKVSEMLSGRVTINGVPRRERPLRRLRSGHYQI